MFTKAQGYKSENHVELLFDGVPALMDTVNHIMYVSVLPDTPTSFKPTVTVNYEASDSAARTMTLALAHSGTMHELPHKYNVTNWNAREWVMRMNINKKETIWQLVITTLPIVNLDVSMGKLKNLYEKDPDSKMDCNVRIIDPLSRLNDSIVFNHFAGVKIRGQHSSHFAKKSMSLEIRDPETLEEADANLFGIREDGDWVLDAMFVDPACMRNRTLTDIWNTISDLPYEKSNPEQCNGAKGLHVEVFVRGEYYGLYCFSDKIDRKKLGLKKPKAKADGSMDVRGYMVRGKYVNDATLLNDFDPEAPTDTFAWNGWAQEYPTDTTSQTRWPLICELIQVAYYGKHSDGNYKRLKTEFDEWFYMDNCVDYFIFINAFYLIENTNKNYFLSFRDLKDGHRALFTLWDMDASLGRNGSGEDYLDKESRYGFNKTMISRIGLFNRLMTDNVLHFQNRIRSRWDELKNNQLSVENISTRLRTFASKLNVSGAYTREHNKWPAATVDSLDLEVDRMIRWYERNYHMMDSIISKYKPYAGQDDPVVIRPDVNNDGTVDTQDVLSVYNYMRYGSIITTEDVNIDGVVDTQDVLSIYEQMKAMMKRRR